MLPLGRRLHSSIIMYLYVVPVFAYFHGVFNEGTRNEVFKAQWYPLPSIVTQQTSYAGHRMYLLVSWYYDVQHR